VAPISFCETTTCTSPEATKRKNRGSAMKSECASPNRENPTGARAPHLSQVKDDLRPEGLEAGRDLLDAPHDLGPKSPRIPSTTRMYPRAALARRKQAAQGVLYLWSGSASTGRTRAG